MKPKKTGAKPDQEDVPKQKPKKSKKPKEENDAENQQGEENANNNEILPKVKKTKAKKKDTSVVQVDGNSENVLPAEEAQKPKKRKTKEEGGGGGFRDMGEAERLQAIGLLENGMTQQEVAAKYGVAASSISRLHKQYLETGSVARKKRAPKRTSAGPEGAAVNQVNGAQPQEDPHVNHDDKHLEADLMEAWKSKSNDAHKTDDPEVDEHLNDEFIHELALDTESDDEEDAPIAPVNQEHHEDLNAITWPEKDLLDLIQRMESHIPEKDSLAYNTRTEKLNWDNIAFNDYTAEECRNTWILVQKRLRKFRLLSEVLHDAKEWISKPWTDFYRGSKNKKHPDFPKRPLSRYMIYYMKKKDKILKEHPKMEMTDVSKLIAKMYKNLPQEKQEKYAKIANKNREEYDKKIEAFYQLHPELRAGKLGKGLDGKAVEPGPKKPNTPFCLFYLNQLKSVENANMDKNLVKEKCKEQWRNLSDKKKVVWINWAEEEEIKYQEELKNYLIQNPTFVPVQHVRSVLTKDERMLKERMAGKPIKPPSSAYSLFSQIMLQSEDIKKVSPKERMNVIATIWKSFTEDEKKIYKEKVAHLMEQYKLNFASYLESLTEEKRQEELMNIQPKRKKIPEHEELPNKKVKKQPGPPKSTPTPEPADASEEEASAPMDEMPPPKEVPKDAKPAKKKRKPKGSESSSDESGDSSKKVKTSSEGVIKQVEVEKEEDDEEFFKREPKQPPKTAFEFFELKYKSKPPKDPTKTTKDIWENFSKVTKRKYEKELDELKHAYLMEFEKFLKSMSKARLKRYRDLKLNQDSNESSVTEQNSSQESVNSTADETKVENEVKEEEVEENAAAAD